MNFRAFLFTLTTTLTLVLAYVVSLFVGLALPTFINPMAHTAMAAKSANPAENMYDEAVRISKSISL